MYLSAIYSHLTISTRACFPKLRLVVCIHEYAIERQDIPASRLGTHKSADNIGDRVGKNKNNAIRKTSSRITRICGARKNPIGKGG
jgi:hypothetical protein